MYEAVVAPVPPDTFVYGPPEVEETCHCVDNPEEVEKPVADMVLVTPAHTFAEPLRVATGAFGVPVHGGNMVTEKSSTEKYQGADVDVMVIAM